MRGRPVVALSGAVCAGKSTLARNLTEKFECHVVSTRELILLLRPDVKQTRTDLQHAGQELDRLHGGSWVANALTRHRAPESAAAIILDSVRTLEQVRGLRVAFGARVIHVHLTAAESLLRKRHRSRRGAVQEDKTFEDLRRHPTEASVESLREVADIVIQTDRCSEGDVLSKAAALLGFFDKAYRRLVDVMVGGSYGSEGKGHLASYLAPEYDVLIRVGGPNAGHTVYEKPAPYTHHHLPSGTRRSEAELVLAPGSVINTTKLLKEVRECGVNSSRLSIDPQATVITAADVSAEAGITKSIGSTGQGVGAATARRIRDRGRGVTLAKDVRELAPFVRDTQEILDRAFYRGRRVFLEGTQGTGLSLYHGSYPHVTSRDTTVSGCLAEAGIAPMRLRRVILVVRTYPIRVQSPLGSTSGPMGTELNWSEIARRSGIPVAELRRLERTSTTRRKRRVAEFDWSLLRRSTSLNGPTDVALTFVDYISRANRSARRYEQLTQETIRFVEDVERATAAPASLITVRFDYRSIIDRRAW